MDSTLIERFEPMIIGLAHRYAAVGIEVDDLAQEARMRLVTTDLSKADNTEAFANTCIRNCMVSQVRKHRRHFSEPLDWHDESLSFADESQPEPCSVLIRRESMAEITEALRCLGESDAWILWHRYVDKGEWRDGAKRIGVAKTLWFRRLGNAKARMRNFLVTPRAD